MCLISEYRTFFKLRNPLQNIQNPTLKKNLEITTNSVGFNGWPVFPKKEQLMIENQRFTPTLFRKSSQPFLQGAVPLQLHAHDLPKMRIITWRQDPWWPHWNFFRWRNPCGDSGWFPYFGGMIYSFSWDLRTIFCLKLAVQSKDVSYFGATCGVQSRMFNSPLGINDNIIVLRWAVATFQSTRNVPIYHICCSLATRDPNIHDLLSILTIYPCLLTWGFQWVASEALSRTPSPKKPFGKGRTQKHFRKASELPKNLPEIYMFFSTKKYTPPKTMKSKRGILGPHERTSTIGRSLSSFSFRPMSSSNTKWFFPVENQVCTCWHMLLQLHVLHFWKYLF